MKFPQRILALILILTFCLGFFPSTAFADEITEDAYEAGIDTEAFESDEPSWVYESNDFSESDSFESEEEIAEAELDAENASDSAENSANNTELYGDTVTWDLSEDGELTISGYYMPDYTRNGAPWSSQATNIKKITIRDGITKIGDYAFSRCRNVTEVSLPNSVLCIGAYAFESCNSMTTISSLKNVNEIGSYAFQYCAKLDNVELSSRIQKIDDNVFDGCASLTEIVIPSGVRSIGNYAFCNCINLSRVVIPDSVTEIGVHAFFKCSNITEITIPYRCNSLGDYAFYGCKKLAKISSYCSTIMIGNYTFAYCCALSEIDFSKSITRIGTKAFLNCASLTKLKLSKCLVEILESAFDGCSNLLLDVVSGSPAEAYAINNNINYEIREIVWSLDENGVLTISGTGAMDDYDSSFGGDNNIAPWHQDIYDIETIVIEDGITSIGSYAFENCESLKSVVISSSVTSIGGGSFYACSNLSSIEWTNSITSIGINAFSFCYRLETISIPDSVISIGQGAFLYCSSLKSVSIGSGLTKIGSSPFEECRNLEQIIVSPENNSYIAVDGILFSKEMTTLVCYPAQISNSTYTIPSTVSCIDRDAFSWNKHLESVSVPQSVKILGAAAFYRCSSLISVEIPESVTAIGGSAFAYCTSLKSVSLPSSLSSIESYMFEYCKNLSSIVLPENIIEISKYAFYGCSSLNIEFPKNLKKIGEHAFSRCKSITSIIISSEKIEIYNGAFEDCSGVANLSIQSENVTLGGSTFMGCTNLSTVVFPNCVNSIPSSTFSDCKNLISFSVPSGIKYIDYSAFSGCSNLEIIEIPASVISIGEDVFLDCNLLNIVGEKGSRAEIYAIQENIPFFPYPASDINSSIISLDREYMVLEAGAYSQLIKATTNPAVLKPFLKWSVECADEVAADTAVPEVISIDAAGNVTPISAGVAYTVASISLGDKVFTARCRVDVTENLNEAIVDDGIQVGLAQSAATLNLYSTDYATVDVILMLEQNLSAEAPAEDNGAAVAAAMFDETVTKTSKDGAAANELFDLRIKDDRTLVIVPKKEALRKIIDGRLIPQKTYTANLIITVGEIEFTTSALKLTVSTALPKLKAAAVKFNAKDIGNVQSLKITGGTVTGLSWKTELVGSPFELDGEAQTVALSTLNPPASFKAGKLELLADVKGWAVPVPVTVSYSYANKDVALKLMSSGVTLRSGSMDTASIAYTITPNEFANPEKYTVELLSITETVNQQTVNYENGKVLQVILNDDSTINVAAPNATTDGKAHSYKVSFAVYDQNSGIQSSKTVTLTVKVLPATQAVTVTAKASGSIDTAIPNSPIKITTTLKNFHADSGESYFLYVEQYKAKTKTTAEIRNDVTDCFAITQDGGTFVLTQAAEAVLESGYTYNAYVSVDIDGDSTADYSAKAVKLGIKWSLESKVPVSITLKTAGSIDPIRPASAVTITPTFKNWFSYTLQPEDLVFTETVGKTAAVLEPEQLPFNVTVENGSYVITEKAVGAANPTAKYTVKFAADVKDSGTVVSSKAAAVTIKLGKTVVKQSTKTVSLIKSDRYDTAIIRLRPADGLTDIVSVTLDKNSAKYYSLEYLGGDQYAIGFKDNTVNAKAASITAKLNVVLEGTPAGKAGAAVSVKINLVKVK